MSKYNEMVCIQALRILNQFSVGKHITRNIVLSPGTGLLRPFFVLKDINGFHILNINILSKSRLIEKSNSKKFEFSVNAKYNLLYSDGTNQLTQTDEMFFTLTINNVCCTHYQTKYYPKHFPGILPKVVDEDGLVIEIEALTQEFGNIICPNTGALIVDINILFIVKFGYYEQLLIPSYVHNPAMSNQLNTKQQKANKGE